MNARSWPPLPQKSLRSERPLEKKSSKRRPISSWKLGSDSLRRLGSRFIGVYLLDVLSRPDRDLPRLPLLRLGQVEDEDAVFELGRDPGRIDFLTHGEGPDVVPHP